MIQAAREDGINCIEKDIEALAQKTTEDTGATVKAIQKNGEQVLKAIEANGKQTREAILALRKTK